MPTASVTHSFSAGTSAKASEVNTNYSDLIATMNALDQVNLATLTGPVTWNVTTSDLCASMSSSGDAGVLTITQTGVLAATKSALKISDTGAQTLGDASLFIDVTSASSDYPALRIDDAGAAATGRQAALQVNSTTKGVQMPRMTTVQRDAITNPLDGEEIYNTTTSQKNIYDSERWSTIDGYVGEVRSMATTTVPDGWLACDGSAVSRTTYAKLFAALVETHGQGDNSTTFNVPDYRGRFLRGQDEATTLDEDVTGRTAMATGGNTGDNVGSVQGHSFEQHLHGNGTLTTGTIGSTHTHFIGTNTGGSGVFHVTPVDGGGPSYTGNGAKSTDTTGSTHTHNVLGDIDTADSAGTHAQTSTKETRPVNASVRWIIKA